MATRFYLPEDAITPPISPTPSASWEDTSNLVRSICSTAKYGDAMTTVALPDDGDDTSKDVLSRQYVSAELTAGQTITGSQSLKSQCRIVEVSGGNNLFLALGIRVIASDGTTVRKTVLDVTRDNTEASSGTLTNRAFTATSAATNYTTVAGDRLVIEIGLGGDPAGGSVHEGSLRLGTAAASDLAEDDSSTTDNNPWVQLNDSLTFVTTTVTKSIGTTGRDYSTITLWEAALDNTVYTTPNTAAVGECYNDSSFNEAYTINANVSNVVSIKLSVASGQRHTGVAGTGARNVYTGSGTVIATLGNTSASVSVIQEWLELDCNSKTSLNYAVEHVNPTAEVSTRHCIIHRHRGNSISNPMGIYFSNHTQTVVNNILYDFNSTANQFRAPYAIHNWTTGSTVYVCNNTVYSIAGDSRSLGTATTGIQMPSGAGITVKNNIVCDVSDLDTNDKDYDLGASVVKDHNLSSDTTATGTGSLTSKTASNQFVSIVGGSEDLHLKAGADAIDAGTDLVTTPNNVHIDIDGYDRDSTGVTWDMGADEYVVTDTVISVSQATATWSTQTPTLLEVRTVSVASATWSIQSPTLTEIRTATPVSAAWTAQAPTLIESITLTPISAEWTAQAPTLIESISPAALSATWAIQSPTLAEAIAVSVVTAEWSALSPSLHEIIAPSPVTATWSVPTPSPSGSSDVHHFYELGNGLIAEQRVYLVGAVEDDVYLVGAAEL